MRCLSPAQIERLPPREAPSLIALLDQRRNTQNNEQGEISEEHSINYFCLVQLSDSFSPALGALRLWNDCSSQLFPVYCWTTAPPIPHCYSFPLHGFSPSLSSGCLFCSGVYSIIIDHFVWEWKMQFMHHTAYTQTTPLCLAGLALRCWNFIRQKNSLSALILFCGGLCKTECYGMAAEALPYFFVRNFHRELNHHHCHVESL